MNLVGNKMNEYLNDDWVVFIEARMNSTRMPGKVLFRFGSLATIELMVQRINKIIMKNSIYVATTTNKSDDILCSFLDSKNINYFRGSEHDVMGRVAKAAQSVGKKKIISLTGDCPLIDSKIILRMCNSFDVSGTDYLCNFSPPSFPDGMEVQIFTLESVRKLESLNRSAEEMEHTGLIFRNHPDLFTLGNMKATPGEECPGLGLTLDDQRDALFISAIMQHFLPQIDFSCEEILQLLRDKPALTKINQGVQRRRI